MRCLHDASWRLSILTVVSLTAWAASSAAWAQAPQTERLPQATPQAAPAVSGARPAASGTKAAPRAAATPGQTAPAAAQGAAPSGGAPAAGAPPVTITPRVATSKNPAGVAPMPQAPAAPFTLNSRQQEALDQVLARWEEKNSKTKTFKCKFRRREFDATIQDKEAEHHIRSEAGGEIKYKRPDHGAYQVLELKEYDEKTKAYEKRSEGLDRWVCDGLNIYEFVSEEKKLKVHPLPPEMRGEAIADGPVPFIFGAKADKMKARYWIRDLTPKDEIGKRIWLEVIPKYQHDAMNFQSAKVVLNDSDFSIYGLQIFHPGEKQSEDYVFTNVVINDPLSILKGDFSAPSTPWGWTKEVDPVDEPAETAPQQPPAETAPRQAKRAAQPSATIKR